MKYNTFRMIARVLVVLAWVVGICVFALGFVVGIVGGGVTVIVGILLGIVGGLFSFVSLYAFAQFIYVIIDIERNTRATVRALLEEMEPEEEIEGE